jgi:anti-anti-sigma factor
VTPVTDVRTLTCMSGAELEQLLDDDVDAGGTAMGPGLVQLSAPLAGDRGLTISAADDGEAAVVALVGELDLNTAAQAERALIRELGPGARHLVIDLRRLEFCDAAGLRVFLRVRRHAEGFGARVRLVHARGTVRRVLEVSELDWMIAEPNPRPPVTPRRARWYST